MQAIPSKGRVDPSRLQNRYSNHRTRLKKQHLGDVYFQKNLLTRTVGSDMAQDG